MSLVTAYKHRDYGGWHDEIGTFDGGSGTLDAVKRGLTQLVERKGLGSNRYIVAYPKYDGTSALLIVKVEVKDIPPVEPKKEIKITEVK